MTRKILTYNRQLVSNQLGTRRYVFNVAQEYPKNIEPLGYMQSKEESRWYLGLEPGRAGAVGGGGEGHGAPVPA